MVTEIGRTREKGGRRRRSTKTFLFACTYRIGKKRSREDMVLGVSRTDGH